MNKKFKIFQNIRQQLAQQRERQPFLSLIRQAYTEFAQNYYRWTLSLFDEYFLTQPSNPLFSRYLEQHNLVSSTELAYAWTNQINWSTDEARQRAISELTPVAGCYLDLLDAKLHTRRMITTAPNGQTATVF
jgi:hypothetical protein